MLRKAKEVDIQNSEAKALPGEGASERSYDESIVGYGYGDKCELSLNVRRTALR